MTETGRRVFSLDAGRKYFSPEALKKLMDAASGLGYTDFHLLLGNEGLRFVLDDMSLEVDDQTYVHAEVVEAVRIGNECYYAADNGRCLTEGELTDLIIYAKELGLGFIPAIDSPGHMNAILTAMEHLGLESPRHHHGDLTSKRTLDITNAAACSFVKELMKKYLAYFAGKVEYFTIGADEFANDLYVEASAVEGVSNGFSALQYLGHYETFINYVNDLAELVKSFGMKPIVFNDGFYFAGETAYPLDKEVMISYWTGGWEGYDVAKPAFLQEQGHALLNTNDAWYYVLGRLVEEDGYYHADQSRAGMDRVPSNQLPNQEAGEVSQWGAMFAVWCDQPEKDYDETVVLELMEKFAQQFEK
ncbi:family 20 glycosylhydrolase [Streptococcus gallolyticus]|uniref:family 20 glycosylhydrolase n=1 Tax=Streptococcus hepaticus TaxID=3349163 RepID=UPI001C97E9E0|nr:family 20 glycosylhydrolase [Streptococcus gallolyticus]MBY5041518.1 family 20 glycosylhydrolase [Streptococcus gallolyticus]